MQYLITDGNPISRFGAIDVACSCLPRALTSFSCHSYKYSSISKIGAVVRRYRVLQCVGQSASLSGHHESRNPMLIHKQHISNPVQPKRIIAMYKLCVGHLSLTSETVISGRYSRNIKQTQNGQQFPISVCASYGCANNVVCPSYNPLVDLECSLHAKHNLMSFLSSPFFFYLSGWRLLHNFAFRRVPLQSANEGAADNIICESPPFFTPQ